MSAQFFHCKSHITPSQHIREYYQATATRQEEQLRLAVKQYTPIDNADPKPGDVTIIACHANGFPRELYEPFFDELYLQNRKSNESFRIRGIWIASMTTHSESAVLNEGKMGLDVSWNDHGRDLLHMVNVFRDQMPLPLVGIGHSMGGTQLVQLSLLHPRLFSAIVCVEPILNRCLKEMKFTSSYALTFRRDVWASHEEAIAQSRKHPLHKTWDPRVFERWAKHGFRNLPTPLYPTAPEDVQKKADAQGTTPVTFATTRHHEVRGFTRHAYPPSGQPLNTFEPTKLEHPELSKGMHREMESAFYRPEALLTFQQLPFLRPPCLFLYGAKSIFYGATAQGRADKLAVTGIAPGGSGGAVAGRVKDRVVQGGGHFVVFEDPAGVVESLLPWLQTEVSAWKAGEAKQRAAWDKVPLELKEIVDSEWCAWQRKMHGKPKKSQSSVASQEPRLSRL